MIINEFSFIPLLITSGVIGFLSFALLIKMGKIHTSDNVEKTLTITFLSFINFIIFWIVILLISSIISNLEIAFLISMIITLIISIVYPFLISKKLLIVINNYINNNRTQSGYSVQHSQPVRDLAFDNNNQTIIYIFDFEKNMMNCGYISYINTKNSDPLEILIVPFNQENTLKDFSEVQNYIESEEVESSIIVNLELKFQMILIES